MPSNLKGGKYADAGHITAPLDCAESCITSANFMLRGSEHHSRVCEVCAEVCEACAASCDELSDDDLMLTLRRGVPSVRRVVSEDGENCGARVTKS